MDLEGQESCEERCCPLAPAPIDQSMTQLIDISMEVKENKQQQLTIFCKNGNNFPKV
jgi:hypothetical protein